MSEQKQEKSIRTEIGLFKKFIDPETDIMGQCLEPDTNIMRYYIMINFSLPRIQKMYLMTNKGLNSWKIHVENGCKKNDFFFPSKRKTKYFNKYEVHYQNSVVFLFINSFYILKFK